MQPDGYEDETTDQDTGSNDAPQPAVSDAEPEWQEGWGEKPLRDHVRNEETVDWQEGDPIRVQLGAQVEDWAGQYEERPDAEAINRDSTPGYDPSNPNDRARYLAEGPGYNPNFDVRDYVEGEVIPEGTDLSGYVSPKYD